ncbi:hypothetical protein [Bacteroides acidifaciens]|uniref:hypothetical protein n=1 Tax=Bacteroides acidifaciens TaxID=85831 RepID=UPI0026EB2E3C|nr:hypothetical protein [Bacteroides acidifaciens]
MDKMEKMFTVSTLVNRMKLDAEVANKICKFSETYAAQLVQNKNLSQLIQSISDSCDNIKFKLSNFTEDEKKDLSLITETIYEDIACIQCCVVGITAPFDRNANMREYVAAENAMLTAYPSGRDADETYKSVLTNILGVDISSIVDYPAMNTMEQICNVIETFMNSLPDDGSVSKELIHAELLLITAFKQLVPPNAVMTEGELPVCYKDIVTLMNYVYRRNHYAWGREALIICHDVFTCFNIAVSGIDIQRAIIHASDILKRVDFPNGVPTLFTKDYAKVVKWLMSLIYEVSTLCTSTFGFRPVVMQKFSEMVARMTEVESGETPVESDSKCIMECVFWCKYRLDDLKDIIVRTEKTISDASKCAPNAEKQVETVSGYDSFKVLKDYYESSSVQDIYCVLALYKIANTAYLRLSQKVRNYPEEIREIAQSNQGESNIYGAYACLPREIIDALNELRKYPASRIRDEFYSMTDAILGNIIESLSSIEGAGLMVEMAYAWIDSVCDPIDDKKVNLKTISDNTMKILVYILNDIMETPVYLYNEEEVYKMISKCAMAVINDTPRHRVKLNISALKLIRTLIIDYLYYGMTIPDCSKE